MQTLEQPRRAQHPKVEPEKLAVRTEHVPSSNQFPESFNQGIVSDEPGPLPFLANPAEEEALPFVRWSVRDESFGKRK
jgi:hypothetical protein